MSICFTYVFPSQSEDVPAELKHVSQSEDVLLKDVRNPKIKHFLQGLSSDIIDAAVRSVDTFFSYTQYRTYLDEVKRSHCWKFLNSWIEKCRSRMIWKVARQMTYHFLWFSWPIWRSERKPIICSSIHYANLNWKA